jgi:hypothetical protein
VQVVVVDGIEPSAVLDGNCFSRTIFCLTDKTSIFESIESIGGILISGILI